jgi:protein gp37
MSDETKIQWATHTFNPWEGCTKVSPGCANCYAEARNKRFSGGANWGKGKPRRRTTKATWSKPVKWNRDSGLWHTTPRPRIFPSLCDWLDDEVPIDWLADFLKLIHDTPNLDWLLLTKRPENWQDRIAQAMVNLDKNWIEGREERGPVGVWLGKWLEAAFPHRGMDGTAPSNVWIGFSAENDQYFRERYEHAKKIPTPVLFCSMEPLLGPIDVSWILEDNECANSHYLDWAIIGGESGRGARFCNVEWIRGITRQCKGMDIPVFVKQLGADAREAITTQMGQPDTDGSSTAVERVDLKDSKGGNPAEWPEDLRVREFPR